MTRKASIKGAAAGKTRTINLDMDALTFGETEDYEELTGQRWGGSPLNAKGLRALAAIGVVRESPEVPADPCAQRTLALKQTFDGLRNEPVSRIDAGAPPPAPLAESANNDEGPS